MEYILCRTKGKYTAIQTNQMKENYTRSLPPGFVKVPVISSPDKGVIKGIFLANHLVSTDN